MKKSVIVLTAIIGAGLLVFSGCSNGDTFTEKTYSSGETTVNSVIIDVSDREVEVTASSDHQIRIDYFESEKEYYTISETDGTLKMTLLFPIERLFVDLIFQPRRQSLAILRRRKILTQILFHTRRRLECGI